MFALESSFVGASSTLVAVAMAVVLVGCSEPKQETEDAAKSVVATPVEKDAKTKRFPHPDENPPPARNGDQLPADELEAVLAEAAAQVTKGDDLAAVLTLRKCVNKLQPSPRCEGEMGIAMWKVGNHRAHARFYVEAAASMDDPKADAAFWRRLGDAAMRMARFESATSAYEKMVATGGTSADDYRKLSKAMQGKKADVKEVISVLRKAYEAAPTEHQLLFEIAVLTAQIPDNAKAKTLLEEYLEKTKGTDPKRDELVKNRIKELSLPPRQ
jgi:tetratricopeptide (TPR) repeat protein